MHRANEMVGMSLLEACCQFDDPMSRCDNHGRKLCAGTETATAGSTHGAPRRNRGSARDDIGGATVLSGA
jgi:hypothetical protein